MKKLIRRLTMIGLCAVLSMTAMVVPASAKDYVKENLAKKAGYAVNDFGIPLGGQVSNHEVNVTKVSGDDALFVIQARTTQSYGDKGDKVFFSLYYKGMDGKLYYTEKMRFDDKVRDFLKCDKALQAGQVNTISISLHAGAQEILGVYFYKNGGKGPLTMDWLTVARVNGEIGSANGDASGYKFREFSGEYVAYVTNMNDLGGNNTDTGAIWYTKATPRVTNTKHSLYALELVAGSDGYVNKDGTVTINYTDSLDLGHSHSIRFQKGYGAVQPAKNLNDKDGDLDKKGAFTDYNHTIDTPWFQTSVREMQGLSAGYVGNYYTYKDVSDTCLRPYTGTTFLLSMPQDIARVDSITVSLNEQDSLLLQSVRLVELSYVGKDYENYWNGGFGLERLRPWTGRLIAQSVGGEYSIQGQHSQTFVRDQDYDYGRLQTYERGKGPIVDNTGTGVGVSIQIADILGAGIESFAAWNGKSYESKESTFKAWEQLKNRADDDARKAWFNLQCFKKECMTLTIDYKDTLGAHRRVEVPLSTTYLVYILKENKGKLSGGDWTTWISGIFQQNENVALPLRLAEYAELQSIALTYGSAPWGFDSSNSKSVNTGNDPLTIENICFYEGVNGSNFKSEYDKKKLACVLNTSLKPKYSYSVEGGQRLTSGGSVSASTSDGSLVKSAPKARDYSSKYLVKIKTADIQTAGTTGPVFFKLDYTDTNGDKQTTVEYSLSTQAADYYGANYREKWTEDVASTLQYERHVRRDCVCECVVDIPNVASIDAIHLSLQGGDEWQIEYINVFRLTSLEQRYGQRKEQEKDGSRSHLYWRREYKGEKAAEARQSVLLYENNPTKTVYFTTYDDKGTATKPEQSVKHDDYLTALPNSMTFNEAKKDLGLSVVKYTYQVNVKVADVEDAGSSNYFYFQLVFENGTSGVVLANQQLSSDSFRRAMTESFQIKTTQNYGEIKAVRIICDNASSTSNVFDKLNIEQITVTLGSDSGVSKSWAVKNVGWIDITYVDEGADATVDGLEELDEEKDNSLSNVEIVKEFAVNSRATAVDLLFCITTDSGSANDSSNPYKNALGGSMEGTLIYRDSNGVEQRMNFDLSAQIQQYNDTENTRWMYRPNHNDRFVLSMTDIKSVQALHITRTDGKGEWVIGKVSIQQVGGMGPVYLSDELTEYYRDFATQSNLAHSTNAAGVTYRIGGSGSAAITFTNNSIDLSTQQEDESWSSVITREPNSISETLNIYLYPGSVADHHHEFTSSSPAVRATIKYTTIYGGALAQKPFTIGTLGTIDGQTVLFGKNLDVSAMATLNSLRLSTTSSTGEQPYINYAVVERVQEGVVVGTVFFNFSNVYLGNGPQECSPSSSMKGQAMTQLLRLQPAAGQNAALTAETSDIAVALRYTSILDPSMEKTVYRSPYVYLTDEGYQSVTTGQMVEIPFHVENVGEVLGFSLISTGPIVTFDNAAIYNYAGTEPGVGTPLGVTALAESFSASSVALNLEGKGDTVVPALFRFTTAPEEAAAGAGTAGRVSMTVDYIDRQGVSRSMTVEDLLSYQGSASGGETETVIRPGATTEMTLQLSNASYLDSITLSAGDRWLISSVYAELTPPGGSPSISSVTVNNWASDTAPLTVDLRPADQGGESQGNQIQTFTVTGRGRKAGIAASASAGGTVLVTAYPGDTVDLTPAITAVGKPDITWTWNMGDYADALTENRDKTAVFRVPGSLSPGESCTFSVACNGDNRMSVAVTILVEEEKEEPQAPTFPTGSGSSGGGTGSATAQGSDANTSEVPESSGEAASGEPGAVAADGPKSPSEEDTAPDDREPSGDPDPAPDDPGPAEDAEDAENGGEAGEEALEEN